MRLTTVGIVAAIAALGCNQPDGIGTDPSSSHHPSLGAHGTNRPISGRCSTSYTVSNPVFLPPDNEVLLSFEVDDRGTCQLSHLGATTFTAHAVIRFDSQNPQSAGHVVLRAANGDELFVDEVGEIISNPETPFFGLNGQMTFSGGTGRFANAIGTATRRGTGSTADNSTAFTIEGTISY
jgi:hypothetical protein